MKKYIFIFITALLAFQSSSKLDAQTIKEKSVFKKNEVQIGEGILSLAQAGGWAGVGGVYGWGATGYCSMPDDGTGALFITYKHYLTHKFALGMTIGIDNESGNITYGNERMTSNGYEGTIGRYRVHSFSLAIEPMLVYRRKANFLFYGFIGVGIMSYENKSTFKDNIIKPERYYGPSGKVPSNPYTCREIIASGQVTPIGLRFGRKIAAFIEAGFGYKGLISAGITTKF